ncbi:nucleotidyltransferase domain-containing protein [Spirosoma fluviale]|uniref:Predicted nucleotidyltransferase n=1 Tax=Spirosoma fluviale TaxID=1597977 RepID=A0A286GC20_9BACT|nr:nucleotidyltransferase domain-containing protein [Spirosoma fluviale]SOD93038.1 Predicted nucleotidyltransferase [Spirosoma fluviale]
MKDVAINLDALTAEFKQAMQELYGERLAKVILYGSYARGDFQPESDVDFMVVLKDRELKRLQEIERTTDVVLRLFDKYGRLISFMPTTEETYTSNDFLFYRNIRREGRQL